MDLTSKMSCGIIIPQLILRRKSLKKPRYNYIKNKTSQDVLDHLKSMKDVVGECWIYKLAKDKDGYGAATFNGRSWKAHRLMYTVAIGEIPIGQQVCHRCDNPSCINPAHLFVGTAAQNNHDRHLKGRDASGVKNGAYTKPDLVIHKGSDNGSSKLTEAQVLEIRARYQSGRAKQLASEYGVSTCTIYLIIRGANWRHI